VPKWWTPAEIRRLRRLYPNMENEALGKRLRRSWAAVQQKAMKLGLRKSAAFLRGPECRFQKGMVPWNLGVTGYMGANRASFRNGHKPWTCQPIGTERTDKDGNLVRKVSEAHNRRKRWRPVKDLIWEAAHGPIPSGRFVVTKDRSRNIALSNLELVTRAENMRRNTYHRYPKDIARLIQLRGALNRQINKRLGNEKQAVRPA
jgi:hypothetical protein